MTSHNRYVNEYFNQTHNDYRRLWGIDRHLGLHCGFFDDRHPKHDDAVTNMNAVLADTARITAADRVLDAGCGIGGSALWIAETIGADVTGVNINEKQITIAAAQAIQRNLDSKLQFHLADFTRTGLDAESFDVVWALESLCYAADKGEFLAEAFRLLKPGGRLIIADGFLTTNNLDPNEQKIVQRWCRGWAIPGVLSLNAFHKQLRESGFNNIQDHDVTQHVAPSSRRIYQATLLLLPLGLLMYYTGLRTRVQTRGIPSGYYQYVARKKGLGVYSIFCAEK